ncbi:hypothetical protein SAMN05192588_0963 [Nonlabens sp. Hel1_33_55]|uniref:hypothetical protein n=1 Tax=Nonlabens sp. Hel1_33_55 TaxID=1336802 RepID=UPI000875D32B|nr:hypothetical protein [Nonlabens sp. Hel1_33_55]SCY06522.1 hypothetical protein SAMN05192588_0963 [Nonlabens sp. Hel1_33_55]
MNLYKTFFLVWMCVPLIAIANPNDKYRKTKKINKTYSVNSDALVDIENSFGDVTVQLWNQNTVSIDVLVEVSGNDEDRVNDRLERIDVEFKASKTRVSAQSDIPNENSGFMSLFSGNNKTSTKVDFIIKMPMNSPLELENDYGAVIIEKMMAPLKMSCDFGRLQIGQLLHPNNELSFDYTTKSHIDYMKGGVIKADFSEFKLYGAGNLDLSGDYTTATFGAMEKLKYNSDFSTYNIERIKTLDGRGDYSKVTIDTVEDEAIMKADFGTITINSLSKGFKNVNIKSDYTTVKVRYDKDASFVYECKTEFGSLNLGSGLATVNSRKEMNESYKQGYNNTQGSNNRIDINSSFGNVSLQANN